MNVNVRASEGADGVIVITSAWCWRCRRNVMPTYHGRCAWCELRIVDEDTLKAAPLLAQIRARDAA